MTPAGRLSTTAVGLRGEARAREFLAGQGYRVLAERVRRGAYEIDILAYEADVLCFVEVRTRRATTSNFGGAAQSLTSAKLRRLSKCAAGIIADMADPPRCRFDVVGIDGDAISLTRNAFTADFTVPTTLGHS